MKKYIIQDWAGNVLFGKCFNNEDEATDYMYNNLDDDEIEEVSILLKSGYIRNNKFYIES
jgi:hypothetical protein